MSPADIDALRESLRSLRSRAEAAAAEATHETSLRVQWQARSLAAESERDAARAEAERLREALRMAAQLIAPLGSDSGQERWDLAKKLRALTPSPSPETKP